MSLTKLSLAGNNFIIPGQGDLVSDIPAWEGKITNLFLQCGAGSMGTEKMCSTLFFLFPDHEF
jgi:hypothetical protein